MFGPWKFLKQKKKKGPTKPGKHLSRGSRELPHDSVFCFPQSEKHAPSLPLLIYGSQKQKRKRNPKNKTSDGWLLCIFWFDSSRRKKEVFDREVMVHWTWSHPLRTGVRFVGFKLIEGWVWFEFRLEWLGCNLVPSFSLSRIKGNMFVPCSIRSLFLCFLYLVFNRLDDNMLISN